MSDAPGDDGGRRRRVFNAKAAKAAKSTKKKVKVKHCASREALNLNFAFFVFFAFLVSNVFLASPQIALVLSLLKRCEGWTTPRRAA